MTILAIALLTIWVLGVFTGTLGILRIVKDEKHPLYDQVQFALWVRPVLYPVILSVLTVFWPATLMYGLATRRK